MMMMMMMMCNSLIDWGTILGLTMGMMFGNATINHPDETSFDTDRPEV